MMYIHYCQKCYRTHMLNGHQTRCPICNHSLQELSITYLEYVELDTEARNMLITEIKAKNSTS